MDVDIQKEFERFLKEVNNSFAVHNCETVIFITNGGTHSVKIANLFRKDGFKVTLKPFSFFAQINVKKKKTSVHLQD